MKLLRQWRQDHHYRAQMRAIQAAGWALFTPERQPDGTLCVLGVNPEPSQGGPIAVDWALGEAPTWRYAETAEKLAAGLTTTAEAKLYRKVGNNDNE